MQNRNRDRQYHVSIYAIYKALTRRSPHCRSKDAALHSAKSANTLGRWRCEVSSIVGRSWRLAALALSVLFLFGCQSLPHQPQLGGETQRGYLQPINQWQAEGKIAFSLGDENQTATFRWTNTGDNYAIHLYGPFGQGATWLRRTSKGVTLESAETGYHQAESAEALMQQTLGWQVPIANLQHWIKGVPARTPKPQKLTTNAAGYLEVLQQQGWHVEYTQYQNVAGWHLPRKLRAERDGIRIVLVIKNWEIQPAPPSLVGL